MNNQITTFNFQNNQIRSFLDEANNPWFVATDVCKVLSIKNTTDALKNIDEDCRSRLKLDRNPKPLNTINESGLYTLVLRCDDSIKAGTVAYKFRRWVTKEVLPQIRKTGKYESKPKPTMRQGYSVKDLWNTPDSYFLDKIEEYHKKNIIKNSLALDIKYCFDMRVRDNIINTIRLVENTPVLPETKLSTSEFLSMNEQEKLVIMRENGLKCELYSFNENLKWYKFKKCPFPYIDLQSVAMLFGFDIKLLKMSFFKNIDSFILGKDLIIIDDTNKIDDESYLLSFTGIERIFNHYFA